jgi:hypothetical protein
MRVVLRPRPGVPGRGGLRAGTEVGWRLDWGSAWGASVRGNRGARHRWGSGLRLALVVRDSPAP